MIKGMIALSTYLQKKNPHFSLSCVLDLKPTDLDLLARSSVSETVSGDFCLVCDSTIYPISFVLVVYTLNNYLLLVLL